MIRGVHAAIRNYLLSLTAFVALIVAVAFSQTPNWVGVWLLLLLFVALPVLVLTWVDLGRALRNAPSPSRTLFVFGVIVGVPQALLGLVAFGIGAAIVVWVLYNTFVERQPQYSGGFLRFGIGPVLMLAGAYWVRQAFKRDRVRIEHLSGSGDLDHEDF